ncbi:MAG TPA: glycosyltransferase family 4 protein [Gammaproteobacteria bacterium]|nr:glycosyltransferase family 4 protein [Gammaproteobacteria bacterium]
MKPKILMAAYTNYPRDPRVKREAEALVAEGYKVVFLASRDPFESRRETIAGVEVIKVMRLLKNRTSMLAYMLNYGYYFLALALHLSIHPLRYRLIHINNMPDFLVLAAWLPRLLGRPVIYDVHDLMPELFTEKYEVGDDHWFVRLLCMQERWAGSLASAVLTVEERLRDILDGRGIPRDKIRILLNLPDERIFSPRTDVLRKSPDDPFVIVYHGTLARRLGLDIALHAVARVGDRIPNLEMRIIGGGEERDDLLELRETLGLQDRVTFSDGYVPVETIPGYLRDVDVGLVPNRVSSGTDIMLPTKLLEYVTVGIPCIVPPTGTIRRYFDEKMVRFFEAENVDALAQAMIELYENPQLRESLVREATRRFSSSYRWSRHKDVYVELVEHLLSSTASGRKVARVDTKP